MSEEIGNVIDGVFVGALLGGMYVALQAWQPDIWIYVANPGFILLLKVLSAAICGGIAAFFLQIRKHILGGFLAALIWSSFLTLLQIGFSAFASLDLGYAAAFGQLLLRFGGTALLGIAANLVYSRAARLLWPLDMDP